MEKGYSYNVYVNNEMAKKADKIFTLEKTTRKLRTGRICWKFKENPFDWSEDLFELVEQETEKDYAIICKDNSLQDSSVRIGQKYKNSVGTINIITKVTNTKVLYQPEHTSKEYSCTVENVKKNWKLISKAENTQTYTTYQIIKKDKYEVGAKAKLS